MVHELLTHLLVRTSVYTMMVVEGEMVRYPNADSAGALTKVGGCEDGHAGEGGKVVGGWEPCVVLLKGWADRVVVVVCMLVGVCSVIGPGDEGQIAESFITIHGTDLSLIDCRQILMKISACKPAICPCTHEEISTLNLHLPSMPVWW